MRETGPCARVQIAMLSGGSAATPVEWEISLMSDLHTGDDLRHLTTRD